MGFEAFTVKDSISAAGCRLTTLEVSFPRFVLSEFNTPRAFSRNSASSRAIPVDKQIKAVMTDPFVPIYWGKNQPGMQALEEIGLTDQVLSEKDWLEARDAAVSYVQKLLERGLHKQIPNRLLEPFMFHRVLVTATEWNNFYALRVSPAAQPEIMVAADLMRRAHNASIPQELKEGEYHLPLIQKDELEWAQANQADALKVSVARSARVSYMTHNNVRDVDADIEMYDRLLGPGHMSPFEHVATPFSDADNAVRDFLKKELAAKAESLSLPDVIRDNLTVALEFDGNFRGWHQHRKDIQFEADYSLRP